jgi:hypothetical protein
MQCPRCLSVEIVKSRRSSWERVVLPVLRAEVYRCRDCRWRFRVGVEMGGLILGTVLAVVTAVVIAAMLLVGHRNEDRTSDSRRHSTPGAIERISTSVAVVSARVPGCAPFA